MARKSPRLADPHFWKMSDEEEKTEHINIHRTKRLEAEQVIQRAIHLQLLWNPLLFSSAATCLSFSDFHREQIWTGEGGEAVMSTIS